MKSEPVMSSGPNSKIQQAMELALEHQRSGRLRGAAAIYRQVLQYDPDNSDALHFLGVIAHKIGRADLAMDLLARSVAADPSKVGFQLNLGNLYLKQQRLDEAVACYRAAIRYEPQYASAYAHLGNALLKQGKREEADAAIRRAWELRQEQALPVPPLLGNLLAPPSRPLPEPPALPEAAPPPELAPLPQFDPSAPAAWVSAPVSTDADFSAAEAEQEATAAVEPAESLPAVGPPPLEPFLEPSDSTVRPYKPDPEPELGGDAGATVAPEPASPDFLEEEWDIGSLPTEPIMSLAEEPSDSAPPAFSPFLPSIEWEPPPATTGPGPRFENFEQDEESAFEPSAWFSAQFTAPPVEEWLPASDEAPAEDLSSFQWAVAPEPERGMEMTGGVTARRAADPKFDKLPDALREPLPEPMAEGWPAVLHEAEPVAVSAEVPQFSVSDDLPADAGAGGTVLGIEVKPIIDQLFLGDGLVEAPASRPHAPSFDAISESSPTVLEVERVESNAFSLGEAASPAELPTSPISLLPVEAAPPPTLTRAPEFAEIIDEPIEPIEPIEPNEPNAFLTVDVSALLSPGPEASTVSGTTADTPAPAGLALDLAAPPGLLGSAHAGLPHDPTHVATDRATIKQRLAAGWLAADVADPSAPAPPARTLSAGPAAVAAARLGPSMPPPPADPNQPGIFAPPVPSAGPATSRRGPSAESLRRRAAALVSRRKLVEAIELLSRAVELRPTFAEAHRDLGGALLRRGDLDSAIASLKRALELKPGFAEAWASLGDAYQLEGKVAKSIRSYRRLLELIPSAGKVHSNLLLTLNYDSRVGADEVYQEHLQWAARHAEPLTRQAAPHPNDRSPDRRLKVGYISPDFRRHSVNYFIEPVLTAHDRERFHVTCYSDVIRPDGVTRGMARLCDAFRPVRVLDDEKLAERIRADVIDILVDLSGHTGNNRLGAFARRPAPVQVTYLGYPNTTGMSAMDYRITDNYADPPGRTERLHSEQLVRMPETFLCYHPPAESPEVGPPPCLTAGHVTFGCFNILAKVTPEVMALWAKVLMAVPRSRLVLKGRGDELAHESRRQFVRDSFVYHGVAADRLDLLPKVSSYTAHLELYRRLDLVLDPFPYNGTTTTCEALWMGLPVIALAGDRHVSRVGVSILSNVGLADLVARTPDQYVRVAASMVRAPQDLAALRAGLRQRMLGSPLTDAPRFTQALEERYRQMWVKWCQTGAGASVEMDTLTLKDE